MTAQYPSPPDLDGEGDVEVGLGAALVDHLVPLGGHACTIIVKTAGIWRLAHKANLINQTSQVLDI